MKEIRQTPFGRLLCWLGIHSPVIGGWNADSFGQVRSTWGGCVRCNHAWQWDNP